VIKRRAVEITKKGKKEKENSRQQNHKIERQVVRKKYKKKRKKEKERKIKGGRVFKTGLKTVLRNTFESRKATDYGNAPKHRP